MDSTQILNEIAELEAKAKATPLQPVKVRAGLYYIANYSGGLFSIEHVTRDDGFAQDEWTVGTDRDPHADQYETMREAIAAFRKTYDVPLTPQQVKKLDSLRERLCSVNGRDWEVKRWELEAWSEDKVTLTAEVGPKGDEGTEAMFLRKRYFIFVGTRGAIWTHKVLPHGMTTKTGRRTIRVNGESVLHSPLQ